MCNPIIIISNEIILASYFHFHSLKNKGNKELVTSSSLNNKAKSPIFFAIISIAELSSKEFLNIFM